MSEDTLTVKIAAELRRNDEAGPGPVSEQEYLDDATAIIRIVAEHEVADAEEAIAMVESIHGGALAILAGARVAVEGLLAVAQLAAEGGQTAIAVRALDCSRKAILILREATASGAAE